MKITIEISAEILKKHFKKYPSNNTVKKYVLDAIAGKLFKDQFLPRK